MEGLSMCQDFVQAPEHRPKAAIAEAVGIPVIDLSPLAAVGNHFNSANVFDSIHSGGLQICAYYHSNLLICACREALEEYAKAMEELALKLLELIARSLGLRPDRLQGFFKDDDDQTTVVRLNHYPPCPSPDLVLGVNRHKDAGALTVLYQDDVGGLDVRRRSDGEWVRVRPVPDSFIINVGDIIQVWSNDRYESAEHRASVNSEKDRFSLPYFFNPSSNAMIEPLDELVSDDSPPRYEAYNWGEFFRTKRNSNFRKLAVENVQIAHFRKDLKSVTYD